jgi:hypothetical protein
VKRGHAGLTRSVGHAIGALDVRMRSLPVILPESTPRWNVSTVPSDFLQSFGAISTHSTGVPVM